MRRDGPGTEFHPFLFFSFFLWVFRTRILSRSKRSVAAGTTLRSTASTAKWGRGVVVAASRLGITKHADTYSIGREPVSVIYVNVGRAKASDQFLSELSLGSSIPRGGAVDVDKRARNRWADR